MTTAVEERTTIRLTLGEFRKAVKDIASTTGRTVGAPRGMTITPDGDELVLSHSGQGFHTAVKVPAAATGMKSITVDVRELNNLIKAAVPSQAKAVNAQEIELDVRDDTASVELPGASTVVGKVDDIRPQFGGPVTENLFTVDARALRDGLAAVVHAAARDDTLPMLHCVGFTPQGESVRLRATDRFRLAETTLPATPAGEAGDELLIPVEMVKRVKAVLRNNDGTVMVSRTAQDGVRFVTERAHIVVAETDAELPALNNLWPETADHIATTDRRELLRVAKAAKAVAETPDPKLQVTVRDGEMELAVHTKDGVQVMTVSADAVGGDTRFLLNPQYFVQAVQSFPGKQVTLALTGPNRPVVLFDSGVPATDGDTVPLEGIGPQRALMMPIRMPQ